MISVVTATFNRAKLLDKALRTYVKQTLPYDEWEYVIVDDGSTDNTKKIVDKYIVKEGLPLRYLDADKDCGLPKDPGEWRDGSVPRNAGTMFVNGDILLMTHPEIMIPPDALEVMRDAVLASPSKWVTAIPYWLPNSPMPLGWHYNILKLHDMKGFYSPDNPETVAAPGTIDYTNRNQEVRDTWESEVFWAMPLYNWRVIGGFREFKQWGSVDMDFLHRRSVLGIKTVFAKSPESPHKDKILMVYHQWHESKRDMDAAMAGVKDTLYPTKHDAKKVGGLYDPGIDLNSKVHQVLTTPPQLLCNKDNLIEIICDFGLKADSLNPYGAHSRHVHLGYGGIWHTPDQLANFMLYMADKSISSYLEIGAGDGITLALLTAFFMALNPNFVGAVGIDLEPERAAHTHEQSQLPIKIYRSIHDISSSAKFDLIMIDADHSYQGVIEAWREVYGKGKYYAFHDIDAAILPGVSKAWRELSAGITTQAFFGPAGVMGIGVIDGTALNQDT